MSLSGIATGKISTLTVTPQTLSFGMTNVDSASAVQPVMLQSDGTTTISIGSVAITGTDPGDFSIASNTCGSSLQGSSGCSLGILFKPTAAGARAATLTISDSASGSPHEVTLSGSGNAATTLSIAPTNPTVLVNATLQFSANASVTWTATCGTISKTGLFTAPSSPGSCTVTATGAATSSSVSVNFCERDERLHERNVDRVSEFSG